MLPAVWVAYPHSGAPVSTWVRQSNKGLCTEPIILRAHFRPRKLRLLSTKMAVTIVGPLLLHAPAHAGYYHMRTRMYHILQY
jgi:hypothetical protein